MIGQGIIADDRLSSAGDGRMKNLMSKEAPFREESHMAVMNAATDAEPPGCNASFCSGDAGHLPAGDDQMIEERKVHFFRHAPQAARNPDVALAGIRIAARMVMNEDESGST